MDDYLAHYGIQGQKWGIRRFQNPDGSLTSEGKARARKEYKADNKEAFKKGKAATVLSRAHDISERKLNKAKERYENNSSEKNIRKLNVATVTRNDLRRRSLSARHKAQQHAKELIKKYGKEAVSDIHYDKKGRITERTVSSKEILARLALAAGTNSMMALGNLSLSLISKPYSAYVKGYSEYLKTKAWNSRMNRWDNY